MDKIVIQSILYSVQSSQTLPCPCNRLHDLHGVKVRSTVPDGRFCFNSQVVPKGAIGRAICVLLVD